MRCGRAIGIGVMGRRTQLTPNLIEALRADASRGLPLRSAARARGVCKSTFYDWMRWAEQGRAPFSELSAPRAVESENPPDTRRGGCLRPAALAEGSVPEELEALMGHLGSAVDRAAAFTLRAGQQEAALLAYEEALRHYERALQLLERIAPETMPAAHALHTEMLRALHAALRRMGVDRPPGERVEAHRFFGDSDAPPAQHIFRREGEYWTVAYDGTTIRLRDSKGMRYVAELLRHPGCDVHVSDLLANQNDVPRCGGRPAIEGDGGAVLDAQAKSAYRHRLLDLRDELREAEANNDLGRVDHMRAEIEFLSRELARAVGLGGRDRRALDRIERSRINVTRTIRHALHKIAGEHALLGRHLDSSIRTGTFCSYKPDTPPIAGWKL